MTPDLLEQFTEINKALDRCCEFALKQPLPNKQIALMTDASFSAAGYAVLIENDQLEKYSSTRKAFAPVAYGSKTFIPAQLKMSIYAEEFLAIFFAFKEFGHIFWGTPKPVIILTDNKSVTRFFQTKTLPLTLWNACDYVIQFNFTIAHIPGKNNTAADYLSCLEIGPKEKLILRIREDISTTPIELNVQSAGVTEEDQIFYTDDVEETEEQIWLRKKNAKSHPTNQLPDITLGKLSVHNTVFSQQTTLQRLSNFTTMAIEQQNDVVLHQLRLKLQKKEYSETILQQDPRYRHYCSQIDRLSVQDDVITRDYYDETGSVQYRQAIFYPNTSCQIYSNHYTEQQANIQGFPRCFTKSVKNITILELQKSSKVGPRMRNLYQGQKNQKLINHTRATQFARMGSWSRRRLTN